ncbi:MAG: FxLYD domain-containing protein [Clostridia bacterium]|nr:FxLYD domain-containing protein [Clostridia bacterium]
MSKISKVLIISLIMIVVVVVAFAIVGSGNKNKGNVQETNVSEQTQKEVVYEEFVQVQADGTKLNKSEELNKDKTLGTLVFKDIQLTNKNGQTVLIANVTNTGASKTDIKEVSIIILDKEGNELGTVVGVVIPLNAGQTTQFNTSMQRDYANAYDFKIVEKK